ncbi:unnamed protein product [Caenorhabditis nigoni]
MEFMDAFHFSIISKRSKQMVHKTRYPITSISFRFGKDNTNDHVEMKTEDDKWLKISLSDSNDHCEIDSNSIDGRKLAGLIKVSSDDFRKKLSAHLFFICHFRVTNVYIMRNIEPLYDIFLWSIRKTFHSIFVRPLFPIPIKHADLRLVLNSLESKTYYLNFSLDDPNYKYREPLRCEHLQVSGSSLWLDTDDFLKRNPQMKKLYIDGLPGKQVNDLLKQWTNGTVIDLKSMYFFNSVGYPDKVIFDGIVTMETKLTFG